MRRKMEIIVNALAANNTKLYSTIVWDILEFQKVFEVKQNLDLQLRLIEEETIEFIEELMMNGCTDNLLKEYIDVIYVVEGLLAMFPEYEIESTPQNEASYERLIKVIVSLIIPIGNAMFSSVAIMEAWNQVHKSNLSKLDDDQKVLRREDGKVMKSKNYKPANMENIIDRNKIIYNLKDAIRGLPV